MAFLGDKLVASWVGKTRKPNPPTNQTEFQNLNLENEVNQTPSIELELLNHQ